MRKLKNKINKRQLQKVIFYDLEALKDNLFFIIEGSNTAKRDFMYHFNLLKGNLKDYFKKEKNVKITKK